MWTYNYTDYDNDYLAHHGILGQKWGVRRFQNEDGSLTPEGRKRYYKSVGKLNSWQSINRMRESKEVLNFEDASSNYKKLMEFQQLERDAERDAWLAYDNAEWQEAKRLREGPYKSDISSPEYSNDHEYRERIDLEISSIADKAADKAYKEAFQRFLKDNGTDKDSLYEAHKNAYKEYKKEVEELTKNLFGSKSSIKIKNVNNETTTLGQEATRALLLSAGIGTEYRDYVNWFKTPGN